MARVSRGLRLGLRLGLGLGLGLGLWQGLGENFDVPDTRIELGDSVCDLGLGLGLGLCNRFYGNVGFGLG